MKPSTKDQASGKYHEVKGKIKEKVGRATNDPDMEIDGQDERVVAAGGAEGADHPGDHLVVLPGLRRVGVEEVEQVIRGEQHGTRRCPLHIHLR